MSKPKLIILEGADKVGKTTVYKTLRCRTNYQPYVVDRFVASNAVYDRIYKRKETSWEEYLAQEEALMSLFDVFLVVLVCNNDEAKRRISAEENEHDKPIALSNVEIAQKLFEEWFIASRITQKLIFDTSKTSVDEVVSDIISRVNYLS